MTNANAKAVVTQNEKGEQVVTTSRVIPFPKNMDHGERFKKKLAAVREHKRKWVKPEGAALILNMHFSVHSFRRGVHHADMTLEIPVKGGVEFATVTAPGKTRESALISLIGKIENSEWFHAMKGQGVYFKVTGCEMERLYRGYL